MNETERRDYLRAAADRWIEGVRLQAARCAGERDGDIFFDSNFLVVAVCRLLETAWRAVDQLWISELRPAIESFDDAHAELRGVRNYQEHVRDPGDEIGSAMYFAGGGFVRLWGDGHAETLIDPPRLLEDSERLYAAVCDTIGPLSPPSDTWVIRPPRRRRR